MATFITPVEVTPGATGWQDVDCSALIPAGSSGVIIHVVNTAGVATATGYRKNGSTDNRAPSQNAVSHYWAMVGVDANRVFEFNCSNVANIDLYLVGYTGAEAVYFTNASDISLGGTGAWTDIDISALTGADTAVAAIIEVNTNGIYGFGLRKNGSTDNRVKGVSTKTGVVVGVDASEVLEGYITNANEDFFLTGYFKSGVTMNTNATDVSFADTTQWVDLAALPVGAIGGIIEISVGTTSYNCGLRVNGSAEDVQAKAGGYQHTWGMVQCDAGRVIEGRIANANVDMFVAGYFTAPPNPAITLLNPDHGAVGDTVVITGTTFEAAQGAGTVTFNGVAATVTAWADTSITVTVPVGATTGNVVVTNNTGDASAGITWTLDAPAPAAAGGATPALGRQLQGLGAGAILGQPVVQA